MLFSLLDLEKNCTCEGVNLTHLTWLECLHYLAKLKHRKCMWTQIQLLMLTTK